MTPELELFFTAARKGDVKAMKALLDGNSDFVHARNEEGNTPLHVAATAEHKPRPEHLAAAEFLLSRGAEVDVPGFEANIGCATPLVMAAFASVSNVEMVKLLLQHGADPNAATDKGVTALSTAAEHGANAICNVLLANEAFIDLHTAASLGKTQRVRNMIKADANRVHQRDKYRQATPLYFAAQRNRTEVVKELLEQGADLNATDARGNTPMHVAAAAPAAEVLAYLIRLGASLDPRNQSNETPLHRATEEWWGNARSVVKCLLAAGADRTARDRQEMTPLDRALLRNKHHLAELLK